MLCVALVFFGLPSLLVCVCARAVLSVVAYTVVFVVDIVFVFACCDVFAMCLFVTFVCACG